MRPTAHVFALAILTLSIAIATPIQLIAQEPPPQVPPVEAPKDKQEVDPQVKDRVDAVYTLTGVLCILVPIVLGMVVYLAPVVIALLRGHPNMAPILIVTIFLGWTVIGWIIALTWSFTAQERHRDDYGRGRSRRDYD